MINSSRKQHKNTMKKLFILIIFWDSGPARILDVSVSEFFFTNSKIRCVNKPFNVAQP